MIFFRILDQILDRLVVVIGAFLGAQVPEFIQQYMHRLSGHVAELQRLLTQLQQIAALSNKSLEEYTRKFLTSGDLDFVRQGEFMQSLLLRWETLQHELQVLQESSAWTRPFVFLQNYQGEIVHSTMASFQPGINLSLEGLYYAGVGIVLGWGTYKLISRSLAYGGQRAMAIFK